MALTVVPLRDGRPSLADVAGQLRQLANAIEAGEYGEVPTLLAVMPRDGDYPTLFGWGDVAGSNDPVVQLELAKIWLLTRMTKR